MSVSGCKNLYESVLGAGAKAKKHDKQLTHIVRVICRVYSLTIHRVFVMSSCLHFLLLGSLQLGSLYTFLSCGCAKSVTNQLTRGWFLISLFNYPNIFIICAMCIFRISGLSPFLTASLRTLTTSLLLVY